MFNVSFHIILLQKKQGNYMQLMIKIQGKYMQKEIKIECFLELIKKSNFRTGHYLKKTDKNGLTA